jgi:hypothetical protein
MRKGRHENNKARTTKVRSMQWREGKAGVEQQQQQHQHQPGLLTHSAAASLHRPSGSSSATLSSNHESLPCGWPLNTCATWVTVSALTRASPVAAW